MIGKVKAALNSAQGIESLHMEFSESKKELQEIKKELQDVATASKKRLEQFEHEEKEFFTLSKQLLMDLQNTRDEFSKELQEFKTAKTKLKHDVMEKVSLDIKKEIQVYIMNIKEKITALDSASADLKDISAHAKSVVSEIRELKEISKHIKKEDFELNKHAEMLRRNDREKLELMKKIDNLERLIAKNRRQHRG